jgi:hypothetical protein
MTVGETDRVAEYPAERPTTIEDFAVTLYHALGIPTETTFMSPDGRPIRVADGGEPITELL